MALTLTVDRARWQAHVAEVRAAFPGLVPVVKGNGYGFGRTFLADTVEEWGERGEDDGGVPRELAVGTVHELAGLAPDGPRPIVLTPAVGRDLFPGVGPAVLTVGTEAHLAALVDAGLRAPVILKAAGAMQRYGSAVDALPSLRQAAEAAGMDVHGYAVHPPLAGTRTTTAARPRPLPAPFPRAARSTCRTSMPPATPSSDRPSPGGVGASVSARCCGTATSRSST